MYTVRNVLEHRKPVDNTQAKKDAKKKPHAANSVAGEADVNTDEDEEPLDVEWSRMSVRELLKPGISRGVRTNTDKGHKYAPRSSIADHVSVRLIPAAESFGWRTRIELVDGLASKPGRRISMSASKRTSTPSRIPRNSLNTPRPPPSDSPGHTSTFKSLSFRSLLPFGPNKTTTHVSPAVTPKSSTGSNGAGWHGGFGIGKGNANGVKERGRERKMSFGRVMVIDIAHANKEKKEPIAPAPTSPLPDLSTIIEADTSGISISKHLPPASIPDTPDTPQDETSHPDLEFSIPDDELDLSTSHIGAQVRAAMAFGGGWGKSKKTALDDVKGEDSFDLDEEVAKLIEGDEKQAQDEESFNLDREVAKLLNAKRPSDSINGLDTSKMIVGPSPDRTAGSLLPLARRPQSSLPRLRPTTSPVTAQSVFKRENSREISMTRENSPARTSISATSSRHTLSFETHEFPNHSSHIHQSMKLPPSPLSSTSTPPSLKPKPTPRPPNTHTRLRPSIDIPRTSIDTPSVRTRKRSVSTTGTEPRRERPGSSMSSSPAHPWLGPRTEKAFKAAGLLDYDRDPGLKRYASLRGDSRPGSGRRGSETTTYSRASDTLDSPYHALGRDTPRSVSTAPTSISDVESERMRERHEMETGALLNALSDSQRIVKVLREENTELRERLADRDAERDELIAERQELEEQVRERFDLAERVGELEEENAALRSFVDGLRREVAAWEMKAACSDINFDADGDVSSISRAGGGRLGPDDSVRFDPEVGAPSNPDVGEDEDLTARIRKRVSTASSLFPVLPSNMSMLMAEEGADVGSSPLLSHNSYQHSRKASQGDQSMITMSSGPGSPRSLFLKPEDEDHLIDMDNISFGADAEVLPRR
ncbi:uncharacterized protein EV420DRAFT_1748040 [Desarmillaria tabescens]|uniref:Uncharacterized protein n=1 Tax=Armillaria tabescens TaxID=1929756 RepID=A0AA39N5Z4_ARMTA|nr:uncharacterized protein EV420DRAFT_1748040 [Desarmillaria tabescens]KAK0458540.1 hypothetical protein EV420DRAFT_1748040 [Desarmillaria tabescens]